MSKIKNGGLDQYGAGPFEQQQFGTAGVERVKSRNACASFTTSNNGAWMNSDATRTVDLSASLQTTTVDDKTQSQSQSIY